VPHLIGARKEIVVAMDWTEDRDGQATLALNLVTGHGRASAFENWCRSVENGNLNYRNTLTSYCPNFPPCA
jgi:hypothetical protein